ncbi:MAG TPA: SPFH domain-containing protein [Acidimicrobiales bacterium]|jgi:regulator of protease activity HflC (stomatin/prohibitin superfamily)
MVFVIILAVLAVVLFAVSAASVKIIRPYQRGLIERLGRYRATVEPGLRVILPFVDRMVRVDMRESVVEVPRQEVITSDNVVVSVYAVVYYEATDPKRLIYNVSDFMTAVTKLAQTNLRNVIGDMELDAALTASAMVNARLRDILDTATDKWGTRVVRVEIQRIDPPQDVVAAMHNQMRAERSRRAVVTEASGEREAAITRAEGKKEAAILAAEGDKRAAILEAEGVRQTKILEADGEAEAVRKVFAAIHEGRPTNDLLALKYLQALPAIADGQATKIFLPTEATALLGTLGGMAEMLQTAPKPNSNGAPVRRDPQVSPPST